MENEKYVEPTPVLCYQQAQNWTRNKGIKTVKMDKRGMSNNQIKECLHGQALTDIQCCFFKASADEKRQTWVNLNRAVMDSRGFICLGFTAKLQLRRTSSLCSQKDGHQDRQSDRQTDRGFGKVHPALTSGVVRSAAAQTGANGPNQEKLRHVLMGLFGLACFDLCLWAFGGRLDKRNQVGLWMIRPSPSS